jgi:S-adenosylmethionine-diacylgycerolhomoserine-N-methlytransferase
MILQNIERYYRFHARIYDATRWGFLFGRAELIQKIVSRFVLSHILEIGCGTGKNLANLSHYLPQARLIGLDISEDMLRQARKNLGAYCNRVELLHRTYDRPIKLDCQVFSA